MNSITLKCNQNGTLIPNNEDLGEDLPACEIPKICPDDSIPEPSADSGLIFKNLTGGPIVAYRFANFACNDTSLLTDAGKEYQVGCQADGTFEASDLATLECREPFKCPEYIPYPTMNSGLQVSDFLYFFLILYNKVVESNLFAISSIRIALFTIRPLAARLEVT